MYYSVMYDWEIKFSILFIVDLVDKQTYTWYGAPICEMLGFNYNLRASDYWAVDRGYGIGK